MIQKEKIDNSVISKLRINISKFNQVKKKIKEKIGHQKEGLSKIKQIHGKLGAKRRKIEEPSKSHKLDKDAKKWLKNNIKLLNEILLKKNSNTNFKLGNSEKLFMKNKQLKMLLVEELIK